MKRLFLSLFALCAVFIAWADAVTFRGKAPSAVAVGDQFQLEYSVNAQGSDFRCDPSGGFRILAGPTVGTRRSSSIINGVMSSSTETTCTYYLMAEKEGTYTIPAATVKVSGTSYSSNPVSIKVLPADKAGQAASSGSGSAADNRNGSGAGVSKDDVKLNIELSKTKVYEGEAILATVKLYFRKNVSNLSDAKLPDFEGFTVQEIDLPQQETTLEQYNGANYKMVPLKQYLLFPQRAGKIDIPAATVTAVVQVVTSRRSGGFFDMPMDYYQNVEVPAVSAAKSVTVEALPSGKPASYMGAVGTFDVKASLSSDHVKANEAVNYRIEINGTGNLKYVKNPEPVFPPDFEIYDPKVDVSAKTTTAGVSGKKVIEYTVIPRYAGTFDIPAIEFGYFDTKSGKYKTATTQSFTLTVDKGSETAQGAAGGNVSDFSGTNQERIKVLGNDIRYIHPMEVGELHKENTTCFGTMTYWSFFMIPFLIFVVIAIIYRRRLKLNSDLDLKRTKKANKMATRRLKEAAAALKTKDEAKFYEAVHKSMLGYVSDKLSIPMSELSRDNVEQQLLEHGTGMDLAAQFVDVLSTCEFARYAPSEDAHAMDDLYARSVKTLNSLEDSLKKK